jgi:hypothetical protein
MGRVDAAFNATEVVNNEPKVDRPDKCFIRVSVHQLVGLEARGLARRIPHAVDAALPNPTRRRVAAIRDGDALHYELALVIRTAFNRDEYHLPITPRDIGQPTVAELIFAERSKLGPVAEHRRNHSSGEEASQDQRSGASGWSGKGWA